MSLYNKKNISLYYIFNGRYPSEKAHALYVTKVAESFNFFGEKINLIVPRRYLKTKKDYKSFFNVDDVLNLVHLPTIDLYNIRIPVKIAYFVNDIAFTLAVVFYFFFQKNYKSQIIFSNEVLSCLFLSLMGRKVIYEMHDYPGRHRWVFRILFKNVHLILSQNEWKKIKLVQEFRVNPSKIIVEPNAVDIDEFADIPKINAREKLDLDKDMFIILYTGSLFDWKGAEVLADSVRFLNDKSVIYFIGGSEADARDFRIKYSDTNNIKIIGFRPHQEIPYWLAAADCLVLPNTAKQDISKYYTSPMKLFEYMASGRPIVASDLPSIRSIVDETMVTFFKPDDFKSLATAINSCIDNRVLSMSKSKNSAERVREFTWHKRANRIIKSLDLV